MQSLTRLFGTAEPQPERRVVCAGPLEATLEAGNLRTIRFHGVEVLRAINYLCRTPSWATQTPAIRNLHVHEGETHFTIAYDALCEGPDGRYGYAARIEGQASGSLSFEADGEGLTNFSTNRTGFVVLHPAAIAGSPIIVEHTDGRKEETRLPDLIMADQPVFDIRTLTHEAAPGLQVSTRMEGEAYEMEDQRNWTDASFKTYVRPLAKPRPYVIAEGERTRQAIRVTLSGVPAAAGGSQAHSDIAIKIGQRQGLMPGIGLALDASETDLALSHADRFGFATALLARFDCASNEPVEILKAFGNLAETAGIPLAVEAVMEGKEPEREAQALSQMLAEAEVKPSALLVIARRDFKTRPSGEVPVGEAPYATLVSDVRSALPSVKIGGGTPSNFTEFNRNPPDGPFDFVIHSTCAIVHAADDLSVMETLEAFPAIVRSVRALAPRKAYWLGPATIGARHNPYGAAVSDNPAGGRVAMAGDDPRQRGLFAATFLAGLAASTDGVDVLIAGSPVGRFGMLAEDGTPYPVHSVASLLGAAAGKPRLAVDVAGSRLRAVAWDMGAGTALLLANLSDETVRFILPLDASYAPIDANTASAMAAGEAIALEPYGVALATVDTRS